MQQVFRLACVAATVFMMCAVGRAEDRNVLVLDGKVFGVRTQPLTTGLNISSFVFSPDGKQIAYLEMELSADRPPPARSDAQGQLPDPEAVRKFVRTRLGVVTLTSGRARTLAELPDPKPGTPVAIFGSPGIAWSSDSRYLAVQVVAPYSEGDVSLLVVEVATGQSWLSPPVQQLSGVAWHPRERLLAFGTYQARHTEDTIYLWDPLSGVPQAVTTGSQPCWSDDGWLLVMRPPSAVPEAQAPPFMDAVMVEVNPQTNETRLAKGQPQWGPTAFRGGGTPINIVATESIGFTVQLRARRDAPTTLEVQRPAEKPGAPPRIDSYAPATGGRIERFALSPSGTLVAYSVKRPLGQPQDGAFKLDVHDIWLLSPLAPAKSNTAWVATYREGQTGTPPIAWSSDGSRLAFVSEGNLFTATLEDLSGLPYTIVDGEVIDVSAERRTIMSNLRQIGLASLMFADEHERRLPNGARLRDDLQPFLRNIANMSGRPGDPISDLLEWLAPASVNLDTISRPAETPLGFIAWPPGEVQVAFVDGHVKTFTADAWAQFVAQARAEGWWPPGW